MDVVQAHGNQPAISVCGMARQGLAAQLERLGQDAATFLSSAGLDADTLDDPAMPIAYSQLAQLLRQAAELADCEHLGLLLGQTDGPQAVRHRPFGPLTAPTVGEVLATLPSALEDGAIFELRPGRTASLSYIIADPAVETGAVLSDVAAVALFRALKDLCGPDWSPELVELPRRQPEDARPYRRGFGCPIAFNASAAAIHFNGDWLGLAPASSCAGTGDPAANRPSGVGQPVELTDRVVRYLARGIALGATMSASRLARLFGICGRTLQRELTKARTSYRSLSDQVRFGMARRFLRDTDMQVTEIALALGYADASVLTRAFTRWAGTCPSQWRTLQLSEVVGRGSASSRRMALAAEGAARAPGEAFDR